MSNQPRWPRVSHCPCGHPDFTHICSPVRDVLRSASLGSKETKDRSGPPPTHLRRVRTEGPALSRLKPLGPPHTPQCPRRLLVLAGPPLDLLLVHLKGLRARAARSLKGAARSRVSLGSRRSSCSGREAIAAAKAADGPRKEGKRCVEGCAFPVVRTFALFTYGYLSCCQRLTIFLSHFIHPILIVQLGA